MERLDRKLIVVVSNFVTIIDVGLVFSFGALFVAMMDKFQTDRSTTAIVQSLLVGATLSFGAVSGIMITRIGLTSVTLISSVLVVAGLMMSFFATSIYFLYISIGIITGTGISMVFVSCLTVAGQIYSGTKRLYSVTAINASIPVGALIYPFVLEWLRNNYGLYGTFLILSGITCNTFALYVVCFINREKIRKEATRNGESKQTCSKATCGRGKTYEQRLLSIPFVSMLFGLGISIGALNGFIQLMLDISTWKGLTEIQGLASIVIYHFVNIFARLLPAIVKHTKDINAFICATVSAICGCIGQLILYFTSGVLPYIAGISLSGVALGGILSSSLVIVVEMVRQERKPLAYGLLNTVNGLVSTIAGYMLGKSRDITGSYTCVLLTVAGAQLLSAALYVVGYVYWRQEMAREAKERSRQTALLTHADFECEKLSQLEK